jgi:hypothetical protein
MSHKDSFFYLTQKGRIYLSRCLLGPTIAWTHLSAGSQHGSFPHRLTGPHVSHTDQHFPRPQPSPNNYILKNTCFQGKPIVLVQTLTPPRRRRRPPDGRAARESLPRLPAPALCLIRRPPAGSGSASAMSKAKVYADVNVVRPKEYWDYEALAVQWG